MTDQGQTEQQEQTPLSVYLTGATSPTGLDIIRKLTADGHSVSGMVSTAAEAHAIREAGALPMYGDVDDVATVRNNLKLAEVNTIIHLSPQAFNTAPYARRDWTADAVALRAEGETLITAAKEVGVGYVVLASYAFLYADTSAASGEDAPSRSHGENVFVDAALDLEHAVLDTNGVVLRVGYLFSDGEDDALTKLPKLIKRNMPMYIGQAGNMANWLHRSDLASAVLAAAELQPQGRIYNIVADTPMALSAFAALFSGKLGLTMPPNVPTFMANSMLGKPQVAIMDTNVALKNDAAKADLNWQPKFADVDAALEDILLTWRTRVPV